MAIKTNKTINIYGENIVFETYSRITSICGNKDGITFKLEHMKYDDKTIIIDTEQYTFIPELESKNNFIKQGYLYLKSTPLYSESVDC